jgi:hypothetical protein
MILYYGGFRCLITAVIACLVHSYTSPVLVKNLPNSYPPHTRKYLLSSLYTIYIRIDPANV